MDWRSFLLGVAASVVANVVAFVLAWRRVRGFGVFARRYFALGSRLIQAGLSNFYQSRADYARFRGAASLADYIETAEERVIIVGLWMAQGTEMENVANHLKRMLINRKGMEIDIALIDPQSPMVPSLARFLGVDSGEVRTRSQQAIAKLIALHEELPAAAQNRLDVRVYDVIPAFAGIVLDPDSDSCRVQLDIKLFGQPRSNSLGFEFKGGDKYAVKLLRDSIEQWFDSARPIVQS